MTVQKSYPYILIIGSAVGLAASFLLMIDTIKFIQNPAAEIFCDINPFLNCTSVAGTWQSNVFGFPNPILGLIAFSMLLAMGIMLRFGSPDSSILDKISGQYRARKPLWILVNLGTLVAQIFVMWFFFQSAYRIGVICPYCFVVWVVVWPLLFYTTVWNYRGGHFSKKFEFFWRFLSKNHLLVFIICYLIGLFLIFLRFKDFLLT